MVKRTVTFKKRDKKVGDSIALGLTYHPGLNQLYETLRRAHKDVLKSPRLHSALPSQPRVAFRNPKTIRDKLVLSKFSKNLSTKMLASISVVILTMIYAKYFKVEISLKVRLPRKNTSLIFHLTVTVVA